MQLSVFVYRHEGIEPQLPTVISAHVPKGTDANGLRDRIKAAVTEWVKEGSEDAQDAYNYAGDDFNIGDLGGLLYNDEHIGEGDDNSLVECLLRHGVEDLVIDAPQTGDWTYDTPLVEPMEEDE